jgi:CubicO group peptidase (beta-lactamase class C family)
VYASSVPIDGFVANGYEPVREAFSLNFGRDDEYRELGAALCVYRRGVCVVDLWGGFADINRSLSWSADTLVNVWSTTKGVTALALAVLVERGLVAYDQRVAELWPEFGAAGKSGVTIAQLLSHRAGLPGFEATTTNEDLYDWDRCCAKLAAQAPLFPPGSVSCYHTITYGYLAGEVVRRVSGRTVGTFLREHLAKPLNADFYIGVPGSLNQPIAELMPPKVTPAEVQSSEISRPARMAMQNPILDPHVAKTHAWRAAEIPALNGHASARGVARLFGMVANGGQLGGLRLMSTRTIEALSAVGGDGVDLLVGFDPQWAMGVSRNPMGTYGTNPRTIGHSGWGGSFGSADTDSGLGIGYVCNRMGSGLMGDPRTQAIIRSLESA